MILQNVIVNGTAVIDGTLNTKNLQLWLDANNTASYPGTGTTVTDLSGNGYTQNLSSASAYTVLSGVKCWDFSSTYIMRAASVGPTLPTTGFTYIAWARMIASSATYRTLFRTSPEDHPIIINAGTNTLGMWNNAYVGFYSAGYDVSALANVWAQWATTGDSTGQTFYINGQQVGTVTGATAAGNAHDYTGGVNIPNVQPFGYIANCMLYNYTMAPWQIQQNFNSARVGFGV